MWGVTWFMYVQDMHSLDPTNHFLSFTKTDFTKKLKKRLQIAGIGSYFWFRWKTYLSFCLNDSYPCPLSFFSFSALWWGGYACTHSFTHTNLNTCIYIWQFAKHFHSMFSTLSFVVPKSCSNTKYLCKCNSSSPENKEVTAFLVQLVREKILLSIW